MLTDKLKKNACCPTVKLALWIWLKLWPLKCSKLLNWNEGSEKLFSIFSCVFLNPYNFFLLEFYFIRFEKPPVKKSFRCYQNLFRPFTVWINCSSYLKNFAKSRPSEPRITKKILRSLEQFFLTVGQNNFGNKIPYFLSWEFPFIFNFNGISTKHLIKCWFSNVLN